MVYPNIKELANRVVSMTELAQVIEDFLQDKRTEYPATGQLNSDQRAELFENLFRHQCDMTPGDAGKRYRSKHTNLAFAGFVSALAVSSKMITNNIYRHKRRKENKGVYIIGAEIEDNTVQFSCRPVRHHSLAAANKEAERLSKFNDNKFHVFESVSNFGSTPLKVEQSKQKASGKKGINIPNLMLDMAVHKKNYPGQTYPIGVFLTENGKWVAKYSDGTLSREMDEAIKAWSHIRSWLTVSSKEISSNQEI